MLTMNIHILVLHANGVITVMIMTITDLCLHYDFGTLTEQFRFI